MPGLLRGVARTAAVAGTASAVNGRVQRRQAEKFASRDAQIYADRQQAYDAQQGAQPPPAPAQPAAPPPPPAPASQEEIIRQLRELGELRDQGVLTEQEFGVQKARLLG